MAVRASMNSVSNKNKNFQTIRKALSHPLARELLTKREIQFRPSLQ